MEIFKLHNDVIHDYQSYIKSFVNIADKDIRNAVYVLLPEVNA